LLVEWRATEVGGRPGLSVEDRGDAVDRGLDETRHVDAVVEARPGP
jgi:hypothetical protein